MTNYPRLWRNKTSGQELRVMPWWETIQNGEIERVDEMGKLVTEVAGRPCKFGIITQIGYLLENEHGVWFGVGPKAADSFEDLGEAPQKLKKRKDTERKKKK